jgi:hypothetical protein
LEERDKSLEPVSGWEERKLLASKRWVLIREDDVSYFTDPPLLEELYHPLLDGGHPFNVSTIPRVATRVPADPEGPYARREGLAWEPIVPPEARGEEGNRNVARNERLIHFLRKRRQIEVLQHGYAHQRLQGRPEFAIQNITFLEEKVREGKRNLQEALGREIRFFVPPWDTLSREALSLLPRHFNGVSLFRLGVGMLPPSLLPSYLWMRWRGENSLRFHGFLALEHPGCFLSRFHSPRSFLSQVRSLLKRHRILVLVNHHWEYFFDWGDPDPNLLEGWEAALEYLLREEGVELTTFSALLTGM